MTDDLSFLINETKKTVYLKAKIFNYYLLYYYNGNDGLLDIINNWIQR